MKKAILFILSLSLVFVANAQIVITQDTVWYPNFPANNLAHGISDTMLNLGSNSKTITWSRGTVTLQSGWTCSFVDDIASSYGCADTSTHSFVLHPNQNGVFWVNMKASPSASSGPVIVRLNTSEGNMTFIFGLGALAVDYTQLDAITVYPQPFSDVIRFKGDLNNVHKIELRNYFGQLVQTQQTKANASPILHTENLPAGLYFLQVYADDNQRKVYKLIKD